MIVFAFVVAGLAGSLLASGQASWYDDPGIMASGIRFNPHAHVCAMRYVPLGTRVFVVNDENGKTARCTVLDRGPYIDGRVIDVSPVVRDELGFSGLTHVRVYREVGHAPAARRGPEPITLPLGATASMARL